MHDSTPDLTEPVRVDNNPPHQGKAKRTRPAWRSDGILSDFMPRKQFAEETGFSERTIIRYERQPDGLPHARIAGHDYVHLPGAREWLKRRVRSENPTKRSKPGKR